MGPADSRRIPRVPRYSGAGPRASQVSPKGLSPSAAALSSAFGYLPRVASSPVLQPRPRLDADGLGCCAFARRYWRNHFCFLLLRVLRCFSSPRSPLAPARCRGRPRRVSPFGHRRISAYLPLPGAFRSLSRPSSPPGATGIPRAPLTVFPFFLQAHALRHPPSAVKPCLYFSLDFQ